MPTPSLRVAHDGVAVAATMPFNGSPPQTQILPARDSGLIVCTQKTRGGSVGPACCGGGGGIGAVGLGLGLDGAGSSHLGTDLEGRSGTARPRWRLTQRELMRANYRSRLEIRIAITQRLLLYPLFIGVCAVSYTHLTLPTIA